ncbi:hypothetical protein AKJ41_06530 [candidate division MSBL1 archaeon SCGC-AAA259O05]|uniref:Uncharacterized protein n=1 Tax=candidate division MSBL1 archaeon SCGC-AAA259O05 TaxID=1698271 RepID=A0A133UWF9_9EURY|nr:hypothetical protein AKJ41_06530 [candidate division MSBL1 archaeon SCGC-AAA259O05]
MNSAFPAAENAEFGWVSHTSGVIHIRKILLSVLGTRGLQCEPERHNQHCGGRNNTPRRVFQVWRENINSANKNSMFPTGGTGEGSDRGVNLGLSSLKKEPKEIGW